MTSESVIGGRRNLVLAAVVGSVLAGYAGGASALDFEFDNGGRLNWNTTLSVGTSWRAENPSRQLYTRADGSLIGLYDPAPLLPGTANNPKDGLAGNQASGDGNLNYAKNNRFSTPLKVISDLEYKKGGFGALVRVKAWYDETLENGRVLVGNQANDFNGTRPGLGPIPGYTLCPFAAPNAPCLPYSLPGQNNFPSAKLSDAGFEDEQKFSNVMLLDAYVYGTFAMGNSDLQVRLGNQVINWGESVFIQGVNQFNPIDVPAARRAGAELKEILLPVWAAYINWGFNFGSLEAFYQFKWNNTSVDGCGQYFTQTGTLISSDPGRCRSLTVLGYQNGNVAPGTPAPLIAQLGSQPFMQGAGAYLPAINGREPSDSGQFGVAFRFPVDMLDTEFGLYYENIHSRLPYSSGQLGTNAADFLASLPPQVAGALQQLGYVGVDAWGGFWRPSGLTGTRYRTLFPAIEAAYERQILPNFGVTNADLMSGAGFWEYPEDIEIFGLSAATNLFGWSASAELSYTKDVPAQVNGNDLIAAIVAGIGPASERIRAVAAGPEGTYAPGWDRFDKTQLQANVVKSFSNVMGGDSMLLVAEVGAQWNDVPDYTRGGLRYGRGFMFGTGSSPGFVTSNPEGQPGYGAASGGDLCSPTLANFPVPAPNAYYNAGPNGCRNDGYITDFAWGYRIRASVDYNNVMNSGVTLTPNVYWSHDVSGVSLDPTFNEGRKTLGLGLKATYNKRYTFDLSYVSYADNNFDPLFDRDYYSAAVGMTF
jgi:hypothetical protein